MSSEPSSFSTAFLLSTNEPSGIAEEFKMRYLREAAVISRRSTNGAWGGLGDGDQPLFELSVEDSVGEALSADPDPLQDAVAPQLVKDQEGIHHTWR